MRSQKCKIYLGTVTVTVATLVLMVQAEKNRYQIWSSEPNESSQEAIEWLEDDVVTSSTVRAAVKAVDDGFRVRNT